MRVVDHLVAVVPAVVGAHEVGQDEREPAVVERVLRRARGRGETRIRVLSAEVHQDRDRLEQHEVAVDHGRHRAGRIDAEILVLRHVLADGDDAVLDSDQTQRHRHHVSNGFRLPVQLDHSAPRVRREGATLAGQVPGSLPSFAEKVSLPALPGVSVAIASVASARARLRSDVEATDQPFDEDEVPFEERGSAGEPMSMWPFTGSGRRRCDRAARLWSCTRTSTRTEQPVADVRDSAPGVSFVDDDGVVDKEREDRLGVATCVGREIARDDLGVVVRHGRRISLRQPAAMRPRAPGLGKSSRFGLRARSRDEIAVGRRVRGQGPPTAATSRSMSAGFHKRSTRSNSRPSERRRRPTSPAALTL